LCLSALFLLVLIASILVGAVQIPFADFWNILTGRIKSGASYSIVVQIRLPRILMAASVGGALSVCGVVMQSILRNPLAEPFVLGLSGGAAVGSILFILLGLSGVDNLHTTILHEMPSLWQQLGIDVEKVKYGLLILVSILTAFAVSLGGIIGFVGLIVPHLMRMAFGSDHRLLLPASLIFGAVFMVLADTAARTIIAPSELPVGVITAFLGAPFFLMLMFGKSRRWNQ